MALAGDDHGGAVKAARRLEAKIESVDGGQFSESGHKRWIDVSEAMAAGALGVAESGDIASARDGFYFLSRAAIGMHQSFGHAEKGDYYLTFCPMARNNAGAYWLQTENVVWNSFYGASMLRCGEIKKSLPPAAQKVE
jgi:Cu(I)/Ag(I) efflux system membrane fusion protein